MYSANHHTYEYSLQTCRECICEEFPQSLVVVKADHGKIPVTPKYLVTSTILQYFRTALCIHAMHDTSEESSVLALFTSQFCYIYGFSSIKKSLAACHGMAIGTLCSSRIPTISENIFYPCRNVRFSLFTFRTYTYREQVLISSSTFHQTYKYVVVQKGDLSCQGPRSIDPSRARSGCLQYGYFPYQTIILNLERSSF